MTINRMKCPFCHGQIATEYYAKYRQWICGCFNDKCQIKPATRLMDTELQAIAEWVSSFKSPQTENDN